MMHTDNMWEGWWNMIDFLSDKFQFAMCRSGVVGKGAECDYKEEKLYRWVHQLYREGWFQCFCWLGWKIPNQNCELSDYMRILEIDPILLCMTWAWARCRSWCSEYAQTSVFWILQAQLWLLEILTECLHYKMLWFIQRVVLHTTFLLRLRQMLKELLPIHRYRLSDVRTSKILKSPISQEYPNMDLQQLIDGCTMGIFRWPH